MTATEALQTLELEGEITPQTIKRQYRKLSLEHHPDRFRDTADKKRASADFMRIKDAYDFLKNNPPGPARGGGSRPAGWSEKRPAPEPWHTAAGDDLREWRRQFEKEQQEEERKEKERGREASREKSWSERWRDMSRIQTFLGIVVLMGALIEPGRAGTFTLIWFLIQLFLVSARFGG